MPGFKRSQFYNLTPNEEKLLSCKICSNILKDPMITSCCHQIYCFDCITKMNKCPNDDSPLSENQLVMAPNAIVNLIEKLQVFCDNRINGCEKIVLLEELKQHLDECEFKLYKVCTVCGNRYANDSCHECSESLLFNNICLKRENNELKSQIQKLEETVKCLKSGFEKEIEKLNQKIKIIETFVDENLVTLMTKSEFIKKECEHFQNLLMKTKSVAEVNYNRETFDIKSDEENNVQKQYYDFSGKFKLICTDDINEFLEVFGVSFVGRKLLKAQNPMIDISVANQLFTIKTITAFKTHEIKFFIGKEFEEQRVDGKTVKTVINAIENKLIQTMFDEKEVMIIREFIGDCLKVITTVFYELNGYKKNVTIIQIFQKI